MPITNKMTAAEYAAFTGAMSHPVGQQKAVAEAAETQARQAIDLDYVDLFVRHLEDPYMRLVTEKTPTFHMPMNNWTCWGTPGKAVILAALREGQAAIRARAAVKSAGSLVTAAVGRCPRCDSPDPKRHPAMQFEGEVQECYDPFHRPPMDRCAEPGCEAVATHKYGKAPLCKTHFDAMPF